MIWLTNKWKEYVEKLNTLEARRNFIVYIDETNINLFLRRNFGRSFKGTRCSTLVPTSTVKNIRIIGAISKERLVCHQRRRGCYLKETCFTWVRNLLLRVPEATGNSSCLWQRSCHNCLESAFEEDDYEGVSPQDCSVQRSSQYIEECWSVLKAAMKREVAATLEGMWTSTRPGVSQAEHHMSIWKQ